MCLLCRLTQNFDPARHADGAAALAGITETGDAPADDTTPYAIAPGGEFSGRLALRGDRDWVAVSLTAGTAYQAALDGDTLEDPYLRLYDATGRLLDFDDDGGPGRDALLRFSVAQSGTFYLSVGAWQDNYAGSYTLSLALDSPPPVASLDDLADYLTDGYWIGADAPPRAFDTSASNRISVDTSGLTAAGQQLARRALEAWSMVADLVFVETGEGAQITFRDDGEDAYSTSTLSGQEIVASLVNISSGWLSRYGTTLDSYSFHVYVHETGHALGLGHLGDYNGAAAYGTDETFANDSWQLSIMSYFSQSENTATDASDAALLTPMMADIVAIQNLYGAPGGASATAGDTTYGAGGSLGNALGQVLALLGGGAAPDLYGGDPVALTLYDRGGRDTIDLSFSKTDDRLSLAGESFSDILGGIGNLGIARGTVIENAVTGSGDDTVTGNAADNALRGGGGADLLQGGAGDDLLNGEAENPGFDPAAAQVFRLYRAALDRVPDAAGHLGWTLRIGAGEIGLPQAARGFVDSREFQAIYGDTGAADFVTRLYANVLGRAPDAAGLADWTGALDSGALGRAQVVLGFSESAELKAATGFDMLAFGWAGYRAGWTGAVYRLYQAVLDRAPDADGLADWTAALADGAGLETVVPGFLDSAEFQAAYDGTGTADFVTLLYQNVLGRAPDAAGLADWTDALDSGALGRAQVVLGFSESAEFTAASAAALTAHMRGLGGGDRLEAGAGDDRLFGGWLADSFVFDADQPGRNEVIGLEAWDAIELHGSGFADGAAARAALRQSGPDVLLEDGAGSILFAGTQVADFGADMFVIA